MFKTKIVGILNVTPDSFTDGGAFFTKDAALKHIETLIEKGADMIDIGAESTRPGATPLGPDEEWNRLESIISSLGRFNGVPFSLDTRHAQTARKAILMGGISCINDVSGFASADMIEAVQQSDCKLVIMHSLTIPADKNVVMPDSEDVVSSLITFAGNKMTALQKSGIASKRIIFDPGIGFGKTSEQSLRIVREIVRFKALDVLIYVGHSRKSFLAGPDPDAATLVVSQFLIAQGVDYIRVHDVAAHKKLITLMNELYHE